MGIQYTLHKSNLDPISGRYTAQIRPQGSASLEVIDRIVERDTTVGRVDILGVLEVYHDAIARFLREGKSVVTPLVIFGSGIRGVFETPRDPFDPARHRLVPRVSPGQRLRQALQEVSVERIYAEGPQAGTVH